MTENCATGHDEARGVLEIIAVHVKVLVVVHINGEAFGGEAESKRDAIIVSFHLALLIEGFAEDCFALLIVGGDVTVDLGKRSDVCHVVGLFGV